MKPISAHFRLAKNISDTFDARRESLMAEANEFKVAFEDFNRDKAVMDPAEAEKILMSAAEQEKLEYLNFCRIIS